MHGWIPDVFTVANAENNKPEDLLWLFFAPTETSQQKGREYLKRAFSRREGRDKPNGMDVAHAQYDAIVEWGIPDPSRLARLRGIIQPTLIANGEHDTMIPAANSHILARHIPNSRVRIYGDAGHGFLFQFPTEFGALVSAFWREGIQEALSRFHGRCQSIGDRKSARAQSRRC